MSAQNDGGPALRCCKCSIDFVPKDWQIKSRDRRCPHCKRAQQNATNAAKGQALRDEARAAYQRRKDYYTTYWSARRSDPQHRLKRAARRKVATEIEAGRLVRGSCEDCGAMRADAHHDDYARPLAVRWLCRRCHFKEPGHGAMLKAREA